MRGLLLLAIISMALAVGYATDTTRSTAIDPIKVSIDMDRTGNNSFHVESVESCVSSDGNATFLADIVVEDVPQPGLKGIDLNIAYDPDYVHVTWVNAGGFLRVEPNDDLTIEHDSVPDTDGNLHLSVVDNGPNHETGEGRIASVQFDALGGQPIALGLTDDGGDGVPDLTHSGGEFADVAAADGIWMPPSQECPAGSVPPPPAAFELSLDADSSGNTGTSLGDLDSCRAVSLGETFEVDIVVPEVPDGFAGLGADILYDPGVLKATDFQFDLLLAGNPPFIPLEFNDPLPDTDGGYRLDFLDLSGLSETGPGALARITFEAIGTGSTILDLTNSFDDDPWVITGSGEEYGLSAVRDAEVTVGGTCPLNLVDSDSDTYLDSAEDFMGTNATNDCPATPEADDEPMDAWPVDLNDNQVSNVLDVAKYIPTLNTNESDPDYTARQDLTMNGNINTLDVARFIPSLNTWCSERAEPEAGPHSTMIG